MKKSIMAAVAAAAFMGLGTVGTAVAADVSGFADIRYHALMDVEGLAATASLLQGFSAPQAGQFSLNAEVDVIHKADDATVRIDLDLLNALNPNGPTETGNTDVAVGAFNGEPVFSQVTVEQANVSMPLNDMISLTAGLFNTPFGMEGQDATDVNFAYQGALQHTVPSNVGGAMVTVAPTDQVSVKAGYTNARSDVTGAFDRANDYFVVASFAPSETMAVTAGYQTDNGTTGGIKNAVGNQIDVNVTADLGMANVAAEYLVGDPATGSNNFDSGYGLTLGYDVMDKVNVGYRYQAWTNEGAGQPDMSLHSASLNLRSTDSCVIRVDYTNIVVDGSGVTTHGEDVTVQMVHSF
ncbi:MAG: outer membrane beta-barrel protein [Nitrospirota bacterium]|nr:outer membrane beta-barrel protein [Nitrospirota bacterium]